MSYVLYMYLKSPKSLSVFSAVKIAGLFMDVVRCSSDIVEHKWGDACAWCDAGLAIFNECRASILIY